MSPVAPEWVTVDMDVSCHMWTPCKGQRKNRTRVCGNINESCRTRMSHGRHGRVMSRMIASYIVMQQPSTHASRTWTSHGRRECVLSLTNATWMATQESHMCVAMTVTHSRPWLILLRHDSFIRPHTRVRFSYCLIHVRHGSFSRWTWMKMAMQELSTHVSGNMHESWRLMNESC